MNSPEDLPNKGPHLQGFREALRRLRFRLGRWPIPMRSLGELALIGLWAARQGPRLG